MKTRILLSTLSTFAIATPVVASVSCSSFLKKGGADANQKSDLEFYNYQDYIDGDSDSPNPLDVISKSYKYHEFPDLPDFKQAILEERVAAGVGSDYLNAQLAGMGLLQKIDFSRLYGITPDKTVWSHELQKIYTPEVWKQLSAFKIKKYVQKSGGWVVQYDSLGKEINDIDGDGNEDFLWEYMVPYFTQNKVIAFNPFKLPDTNIHKTELTTKTQEQIETLFQVSGHAPTYAEALAKLKSYGFNKLMINDYFRDNLMIGSEASGTFTGNVANKATGLSYINNFKQLLSGWNVIGWETSGVNSLSSLVKGYETDAQVSMLYNGDALYAYNGADIENGEGQVRIITPKNPTFLVDGVVIPSYLNGDWLEQTRIYSTLRNALYQGVLVDSTNPNYWSNMIFRNFDYVNYTPAFRQLHKFVENNYFWEYKTVDDKEDGDFILDADGARIKKPGTEDLIGKHIAMSTQNASSQIDDNHVTQPIHENIELYLEAEFKKIHKTGVY